MLTLTGASYVPGPPLTVFSVSPSLTNVMLDCLYLMARITDCSVQFSDLIRRWSWGPGRVCRPVRCWVKSVVKLHRGHHQSPLTVCHSALQSGPNTDLVSDTLLYYYAILCHDVTMS